MTAAEFHHLKPLPRHTALCRKLGGNALDENAPEDFHINSPQVPGFDRAERGCLIKTSKNINPQSDDWLSYGKPPKKQRSLFWVLRGDVVFKVDGAPSRRMRPGDFVVFDHRHEHCVLADAAWMGAAWQLTPVRSVASKKDHA